MGHDLFLLTSKQKLLIWTQVLIMKQNIAAPQIKLWLYF
jgi:hypothetical protein